MKKLVERINQKLSPRHYEPYEVVPKIGVVVYKLRLPKDSRVHPVFHASLLKKAISPNVEPQSLLACINEEWYLEPNPERVIDSRRNEQRGLEVLINWRNLPEFENSWELTEKVKAKFPTLFL